MSKIDPTKLRSYTWFNGKEYYNFSRRANLRSMGFSREIFFGKPVIGICNSYSELNNCNAHLRGLAAAIDQSKGGRRKKASLPAVKRAAIVESIMEQASCDKRTAEKAVDKTKLRELLGWKAGRPSGS